MDYDFITTCNWTQTGTFTLRAFRGSSTNVVTSHTLYYRKKGSPTWNSTTNGQINITSTGEWEVANDWNKSGNNVLTHSYYNITAINSCTNVYFNEITLGTTVGDYFLYCWFLGCSNLVSMPVGFNLPQGITIVGESFLFYCWYDCSNLVSMPVGFNLPSGITSVGNAFLNSCWSGCSKLVNMPIGFNIPSGIVGDVGYNFFGGTWMDCTSLTSIPSGFNFPSGITSVSVSYGLAGACWLNCTNLKQDGYTEDLVFEFDSPNNPFGGTCPIVPDSITGASKENPVYVAINRPAPPPLRYWVGGSGNWNDTSHWSASSGGPGGASVPTSEDDVFIDSNSGINGGAIMFDHRGWCKDFICTSGHTYTIKEDDYGGLHISGSLELEPGITWSAGLSLFFDGEGTVKTSGVKLGYVGIGTMLS